MSRLGDAWNKLKDISGVRECVVCGEVISDILSKHSQEQTGLDLCVAHLQMYRRGKIDWDGKKYVEK